MSIPATLDGWALLALDCGNERRLGGQYADLLAGCAPVIDVDHHHDNSRFGGVNLIDGRASSTAEILVAHLRPARRRADPARSPRPSTSASSPTPGRFQYRTTSPAALRLGARLVEAGVDVHKVFERVFESVQPGKLRLLGRVIDHAVPYFDGRLLISHVTRDDLALVEGDEATTEGLIDHLRAVEGVQVAGLIREQVPLADGSLAPNRVSLRSRGLIDVSAIARRRVRRRPQAGRGLLAPRKRRRHPRVHRVRGQRPARRVGRVAGGPMPDVTGLVLVDKPSGPSSFAVLRGLRPALGRSSAMPARSTPSRPASCWWSPAARPAWPPTSPASTSATRPSSSSARVSTTLDPEGEITPGGPPTDAAAVDAAAGPRRRHHAGRAGGLGGQGRRRARLRAHAPRRGRRPAAAAGDDPRAGGRAASTPATQRATIAVRCSKGTYIRQVAADLGDAPRARAPTASSCGGRRWAASTSPTPARRSRSRPTRSAAGSGLRPTRCRTCRRGRSTTRSAATSPTAGRCGGSARTASTRLLADGELRAVAEPRGEHLQPVVVL